MRKGNKCFVFDNNVLISAMIFNGSKPWEALKKASELGKLVISDETLDELNKTLLLERFNKYLPLEERLRSLKLFKNISEQVNISERVSICRDPDDDKFLSLAKACGAIAIITGDKDLLVLKSFENIPIISPSEFLKTFSTLL